MRKKIIGLPRAYLYYKNNKLWRNFFNYLGCSVCVSPSTNDEIRENATIFNINTSYNNKIYMSHIFYLFNKCDYVLVENNCFYQDIMRVLPNISMILYKDYDNLLLEFYSFFCMGFRVSKNVFRIVYAFIKAKNKEVKVKRIVLNNQNNMLYNENKKILIVSMYDSIYDRYVDDVSYNYIINNDIGLIYANVLNKKLGASYAKHVKIDIYNKKLCGAIFYYQEAVDGIIFLDNKGVCDKIDSFMKDYQIKKKYLVVNGDKMGEKIIDFIKEDIL